MSERAIFDLKLLGGATLEGPNGPVMGRVIQPRRLGLLALLAVAQDRGFSRDKILGYLWSETPAAQGRHLLSESIYVIRKALSDAAILAVGDGLRLDTQVLRSDVAEFRAALARGAAEQALELYRGPFLDGFFLNGSLEFERWVEGERRRLKQQAFEAAWLLARRSEAAGALDRAVEWGRRAVALSEGDENAVRHLIGILTRSGNPAAALRVYEELTRELREEYGIEPADQTKRLVEWVRAWGIGRPPVQGKAPVDSMAASLLAEPLSPLSDLCVAVQPFSVHGGAAFEHLGNDIAELLGVALHGAGGLRVVETVTPSALSESLEHGGTSQIADPFGARLSILGRVLAEERSLVALVSVYDLAVGGAEVLKLTASHPADRVPDLVHELAVGVIGGISTTPASRMTRVAATMTPSVPALRAWLEGERSYRNGSMLDAVEAFERAVQEGPALAPAHYRLAYILDSFPERDHDRSASAIRSALLHADSLSDRDRALFEAFVARLNGRANEAERIYARLVDLYPDDVDAWFGLAYVLAFYNPLRGRSVDDSLDAFERARTLDPGFAPPHVAIAYVEARRGHLDALDFLCELPLVSDMGLQMRTSRAFIRSDVSEQERWVAALRHASDAALAEAVRYVVVLAHDLSGAQRVAALLTEPTRSNDARAMGHALLAHLELGQGRWQAADRELERLSSFDPAAAVEYRAFFSVLPHVDLGPARFSDHIEAVRQLDPSANPNHSRTCLAIAIHDGLHHILREYLLGLLCARIGDMSGARDHADRLASLGEYPEAQALADDFAWSIRAWSLWWSERLEEALQAAERARLEAWNEPLLYSPFRSRVLDRLLRGMLLEKLGRGKEAEVWYASIEEYAAHDAVLLVPSLLNFGRTRRRPEQAERVTQALARVVRLLEGCDPEFQPLLDEADRRISLPTSLDLTIADSQSMLRNTKGP